MMVRNIVTPINDALALPWDLCYFDSSLTYPKKAQYESSPVYTTHTLRTKFCWPKRLRKAWWPN